MTSQQNQDESIANIVEVGPRPEGAPFPRWILRADVPKGPLPPIVEYDCMRSSALRIDADIDTKNWPWSVPFRHMGTGLPVAHSTQVALLWDDEYLYVAFDVVDPGREASATKPGTHVYRYDTDVEILISGPGGYYEFGANSIGTNYEMSWQWVGPLVDAADKQAIDRLLRIPNFLYFAPQGDDTVGRVGDLDFRLEGLRHVEKWADRRGEPGWTVEMALPWESLMPVLGFPDGPQPGLEMRIQAYRAHHFEATAEDIAAAVEAFGEGASPFEGWTWSVQGNGNVHNLERWAKVTLLGDAAP